MSTDEKLVCGECGHSIPNGTRCSFCGAEWLTDAQIEALSAQQRREGTRSHPPTAVEDLLEKTVAHLARLAARGSAEPCTHKGYIPRFAPIVWSESQIQELAALFPEERVTDSIVSQFCLNALRDVVLGTNLSDPEQGDTRFGDEQVQRWRKAYWRSHSKRACSVCGAVHSPDDRYAVVLVDAATDTPIYFCPHHGFAARCSRSLIPAEILAELEQVHADLKEVSK